MKFPSKIAGLVAAAAVASSVAQSGSPTWGGAPWRLEEVGGKAALGKGQATLSISPDGKASGSSGCNRFGATANLDGGLRFGPLAATRMACPPELMDQERRLFHALEQVRSARVEDGRLLLLSESGAVLAAYVRP